MSDVTRAVVNRRAAFIGYTIGLSIGWMLSGVLGVIAGSMNIMFGFGYEWNIILWMGHYPILWLAILMLVLIMLATLTTNPIWNMFACSTTVCNFAPRKINWSKACAIISVLSIGTFPWWLLSGAGGVYYGWLCIYGGVCGPIAAMMLLDFYWFRKQKAHLPDYYREYGPLHFWKGGINWFAIIAFAVGIGVGLTVIDYAFFVGSPAAALTYYLLMRFVPAKQVRRSYI